MTTVPPDWLVCITDIENQGSNQLVVALSQSDVSPTRYDLLTWDGTGLTLLDSFIISQGVFTRERIEHSEGGCPAVIGALVSVERSGSAAVLAHLDNPASEVMTREIMMTIQDDQLSCSTPSHCLRATTGQPSCSG